MLMHHPAVVSVGLKRVGFAISGWSFGLPKIGIIALKSPMNPENGHNGQGETACSQRVVKGLLNL
jgi:hypothetical protein